MIDFILKELKKMGIIAKALPGKCISGNEDIVVDVNTGENIGVEFECEVDYMNIKTGKFINDLVIEEIKKRYEKKENI